MSAFVTDNATIKAWFWRTAGGCSVNFAITLDAEPLLRGRPEVKETEITRHVERFEKSLRRLLDPPDNPPRPARLKEDS